MKNAENENKNKLNFQVVYSDLKTLHFRTFGRPCTSGTLSTTPRAHRGVRKTIMGSVGCPIEKKVRDNNTALFVPSWKATQPSEYRPCLIYRYPAFLAFLWPFLSKNIAHDNS